MQRYICNDNNIIMYTYMIIYDYNLHIYIYSIEYAQRYCEVTILHSLSISSTLKVNII